MSCNAHDRTCPRSSRDKEDFHQVSPWFVSSRTDEHREMGIRTDTDDDNTLRLRNIYKTIRDCNFVLKYKICLSRKLPWEWSSPKDRPFCSRAHFTSGFSITIQFRWRIISIVIPFLVMALLHIFAKATTVPLSSHVQNCVAISSLEFWYEQNQIYITFELWRQLVNEMSPMPPYDNSKLSAND